ncbi:type I glyceraldehyde-3-phosphate dehydrogenase [Halioglobus japonicus]|uniref:Glyceraldehyde-3-phosphate dehydrogenase n=1 Tax=Halioglobus japonicus TaxID=930805 RepID=A0AAP8MCM5_9GAMM|nr:type I glyceraldehyde-3-phosphate dehydrogenase [Halioglobus japonicus]AQA17436.1 type I glyceraldehyde-3-phosphate dehydrogenase [Halioglobus japonicus]PLW85361.1 type I glyceraldehyde-3-phosphate dehydrogenase [Halioglobus japonicus]GHD22134.1 D-erythrose-4-phosphate dehydrogenase [Halioglobus japonicus]
MIRLAINGYGRIGRCVLRALHQSPLRERMQVVAINELADAGTVAHLTRYDSTHGRFPGDIQGDDQSLVVDGQYIQLLRQDTIDSLPWRALDVDLVLECTGAFTDRLTAEQHLEQGAGKVLFSQPAQADVDATIVYGINESLLQAQHTVVSAASCTTNGIVPVIQALHDSLGIESGVITTIHSAMNDQPVLDAYHHTDLRKTRAASHSIIPIDTGLARGVERILPEMGGRFSAQALRVPTLNVSAMDLTVQVERDTDIDAVNDALRSAAQTVFQGVLGYTEEPLASCDFNQDPHSSVVDASQTRVSGQRLVKVLTWFDNEWAYANRMLDVAAHWTSL